jgi:hypothetical protein
VFIINLQIHLWGKASLVPTLFNAGRLSTPPPPFQLFFVANGWFREQIQNARENPIQTKSNVENLLDLDLGGLVATAEDSAVSSPTVPSTTTSNILDDLGGLSLSSSPLPQPQVTSPPIPPQVSSPPPDPSPFSSLSTLSLAHAPQLAVAAPSSMDDLLGIFGGGGGQVPGGTNGFGGQNMWGDVRGQQHENSAQSLSGAKNQTNEDILGLF